MKHSLLSLCLFATMLANSQTVNIGLGVCPQAMSPTISLQGETKILKVGVYSKFGMIVNTAQGQSADVGVDFFLKYKFLQFGGGAYYVVYGLDGAEDKVLTAKNKIYPSAFISAKKNMAYVEISYIQYFNFRAGFKIPLNLD
jgi:hypothetical protein